MLFRTILSMKTLLLTILLITVPQVLQAQDTIDSENPIKTQPKGKNFISCSSYRAITYNGHTIDQIRQSNGEETQIQQLWGSYTSAETLDIIGLSKYLYNSNRISFREGRLTGVSINDSNWSVKILGKTVHVGDTFLELKQKFGDDLKVQESKTSERYNVSFNCTGNGSNGLLIYFVPTSNKVEEIKYYVVT